MSFFPPLSVADAVEKIDYNQYLLPAIQRDFVWHFSKIETLFDSLMQGYPIGSMLLWRVDGQNAKNQRFYGIMKKYRERYLIRSEEINTKNIPSFEVVLDGQQRLTALYLGIKGSYAYKEYNLQWRDNEYAIPTRHLYVNLTYKRDERHNLDDSDDNKKYQFSFLTNSEAESKDENNHWFRVGDILAIKGISQLTNYIKQNKIDNDDAQEILSRLYDVVHLEKHIHYYLEQSTDFTRALNIFIRINSGGQTLSYSDLVMSTTISGWQRLDAKKEINGLVDELVKEYEFPVTKDFILRTYLILFNDDIKFRVDNFKIKNAKEFEDHWEEIRLAVREVFQLVTDFGYAPNTLTSLNSLLPIVYYLYQSGKVKDFCQKSGYKSDREMIKRWLHVVLLHRIFGGQAEGVLKAIRDTIKKELKKGIDQFPAAAIANRLSKTTKSITVDDEFIETLLYTQKDDRYAFPILALLFPYLDYKNRDFHLDHCHPLAQFNEKKLKAKGILNSQNEDYFTNWDNYNSIINLQLLDGNENKSKNDRELSAWVKSFKPSMKNHYLPEELEFNDFPTFFEKRKKLLSDQLKSVLVF